MPSSSLFLRSSATLVSVLSLFSATSAADSSKYTNVQSYSGNGFYDGFNFFTDADPTHGFVTYVDKNTAINSGLTRLENGAFRMGVDSDNVYDPNSPYWGKNGYGRPSVRLESKQAFNKGLFIIDVAHMPGNVCGVWPAFWTTVNADTWPVGGEIDIVESISNREISMAVLHTNGSSIIDTSLSMSGTVQTTDCRYDTATGSNAAGCAIANTDPSQYGQGLNNNGGRIFAMEWAENTIKVWSFPRSNYPRDIDSGNPDPSGWGTPVQNFGGDSANIKDNFFNQKIVINTDFCGDFGDAVWTGEGCAASTGYTTCAAFVANNPAAFVDQFWKINSLKVFQRQASVSSSSSSSSSTTSSSSIRSSSATTSSSGFTTITTSSASTSSSPFSGRTSGTSSFDTTSRGFTFTNSSRTATSTMSPTTSSYVNTATSSSTTSTWTLTSGTSSTGTSSTTSKTGSAVIISATGFPGYAQGGSGQTQNWANWATPEPTPSFIKTTITTTYVVPCSTGLSTSTVSVTTSYAGGKKVTYTPKLSVTTYTTSCPADWGFGGPVTVTIPITTTKTVISVKTPASGSGSSGSGNGNNGWGNGSGSGSGSGSGNGGNGNGWGSGSGSGSGSSSSSSSNNNGSGSGSSSNSGSGSGPSSVNNDGGWYNVPASSSKTSTSSAKTPDATAKGPSSGSPTAGGYAAAPTGTGAADWSPWSGSNVNSPIATYTGAASRMGGSVAAVVVAGLVGLMM